MALSPFWWGSQGVKDAFLYIASQRFNPKENQASQGKKVSSACPKTHFRAVLSCSALSHV